MNKRLVCVATGATLAALISACGGGGGSSGGGSTASSSSSSSSSSSGSGNASSSSSSSSSSGGLSSAGVDSWASVGVNNLNGTGTPGGTGADGAHIYTVSSRSELIKALYPDAVIASDGSFTSKAGADNSQKIIYIKGSISLNADATGKELGESDYICPVDGSSVKVAYTFDAYKTAYDPNGAWGSKAVSGDLESARQCAAAKQKAVVKLRVGSNTSIIGLGQDARIIHGNLSLAASTDNIVIRNITFEDAFDYFPQWDPTDSGGRWNSAYDLISVEGATHVWIDHCTLGDGSNSDKKYPPVFAAPYNIAEMKVQHHDGLIDVSKASHWVTLSYNDFKDHDKTSLVGSTDSVGATDNPFVYGVTYHHNYFENIKQRQPRVRFGRVHAFNNYFKGQLANGDGSGVDYPWLVGWTAGTASKLYIENNVIELSASPTGDVTADASRLVGIASSIANYNKCASYTTKTWLASDCETHFYDAGNLLNGVEVNLYSTVASLVAAGVASNQPIVNDAAAGATPYWQPAKLYAYTLDASTVVKAKVLAQAGAGKL